MLILFLFLFVSRLINLQTLNRSAIKEGKINKGKLKIKIPDKISEQLGTVNNHDRSRSISPTFSENADELTPSEDEDGKIEDEVPPPVSCSYELYLHSHVEKVYFLFIITVVYIF